MDVQLNDQLREFVEQRIASGQYFSASDVISAGLKPLEEDEQWRRSLRVKSTRALPNQRRATHGR